MPHRYFTAEVGNGRAALNGVVVGLGHVAAQGGICPVHQQGQVARLLRVQRPGRQPGGIGQQGGCGLGGNVKLSDRHGAWLAQVRPFVIRAGSV